MEDLELAKAVKNYDALEIAKIAGEPRDAAKDMPYFVEQIGQFDTAAPEDNYYTYATTAGSRVIYVVTANGAITQSNVSPSSPTLMSFVDIQTPEYYAKLIDLAKAKEKVVARQQLMIQQAMDFEECYYVRTLLDTAATAESNLFTLDSGDTKFDYPKLVDMVEAVEDYGTILKLLAGAAPAKDIRKFDYDANKYQSVKQAMADLGVEMIRVGLKGAARTFSLDDDNSGGTSSTDVIPSTYAYLVAVDTVVGAPILMVRKEISSVEMFNELSAQNGTRPQRFTFVSPNPVMLTANSKRYLGVGFTGFEEAGFAALCSSAIARFERA